MSNNGIDVLETSHSKSDTEVIRAFESVSKQPKKQDLAAHLKGLPSLLQTGIDILPSKQEKCAYFVGLLGTSSSILPNVRGFYDHKYYGCNLYCYELARYGAGKGVMTFAKTVISKIEDQKESHYKSLMAEYNKIISSGKEDEINAAIKPIQKSLLIAADSSQAAFKERLYNNNGSGLVFETEGDTLADTMKKDFGNFSSDLRAAFQHEDISILRKSEAFRIKNPHLSVVLSSTYDQLKKLIPSVENGLFSRFLFYSFDPSTKFRNVFDESREKYPKVFNDLSIQFLNVYNRLNSRNDFITVKLQEHQKSLFHEQFEATKKHTIKTYKELEGTVNRLALICFRICMILTTIRHLESHADKELPEVIFCSDSDYEKAIDITHIFLENVKDVYMNLYDGKTIQGKIDDVKEWLPQAIALRKNGKSWGDIAKELNNYNIAPTTLRRHVTKAVKND